MRYETVIVAFLGFALFACQTGFADVTDAERKHQDDSKQSEKQDQEKGDPKKPDEAKDPLMDKTPEGYVLQSLDPIGGRIFKPDEWKYESEIKGKTLIYKLYEPMDAGQQGFDNGLTINMVLNAAKATKMNPSVYGEKYLNKLFAGGRDPVRLKKESYNQTWVRDGIIVTERKKLTGDPQDYRIVYETHADDTKGFLIVIVFGATADRFDEYYPVYKTMTSGFVMMDLKKAKLPKPGPKKPGKKQRDK